MAALFGRVAAGGDVVDKIDDILADVIPLGTRDVMAFALFALRGSQAALWSAHADAKTAAGQLNGARATRAGELVEKIASALLHCERLIFVISGDMHTEGKP